MLRWRISLQHRLGLFPFGQWPSGPGHVLERGTRSPRRVAKGTGPEGGATARARSDQTHCPQLLPQPGEMRQDCSCGAGSGTEGETFMAGAPSLEIPKRRFSISLKKHLGLALRFLHHCEQVFSCALSSSLHCFSKGVFPLPCG